MNISVGFITDSKSKTDLLVFGLFEGETNPPKALNVVEPAASQLIKTVIQKKRFTGKESEQYSTYHDDFKRTNQILVLGLGKKASWTREKFRRKVAGILAAAREITAQKRFLVQ